MARPFITSPLGDDFYTASLTTGERLFLVRAAADIVEMLGEEDDDGAQPYEDLSDLDIAYGDDVTSEPAASDFSVQDTRDEVASFLANEAISEPKDNAEMAENLERVLAALNTHDDLHAPTDPALRRLLPDASLDPEVAAEFRKFTDFDLREQKVQRLLMLSALLTDVDPSSDDNQHMEFLVRREEAEPICGALGDIRLVLGERLDLRTDQDSQDLHDDVVAIAESLESDDGDESETSEDLERRYIMGMLFELAGYLQESLTQCMLVDLRANKGK